MSAAQTLAVAMQRHRAGEIAAARELYSRVLAEDPNNFDALHLLGVAAHDAREDQEAARLIERALALDSGCAPAHRNLGEVYRALGMLDRAVACHEKALALDPRYGDAHNSLGIALGVMGRHEAAISAYDAAIECRPDDVQALCNRGNSLIELARPADAIACYERAIKIDPELALAHVLLGRAFEMTDRSAEALAVYQHGLALDPHLVDGHLFLGRFLQSQGFLVDAQDAYKAALQVRPDCLDARWHLALSELVVVHEADESAQTSREKFAKAIADLDAWFDARRTESGFQVVGAQQPFFLAYHECNNRELLSRYGDLCSRLMLHWQKRAGIRPIPAEAGGKIRVGIVSGQIREHSVWRAILRGWLQQVDRERVSFHVFYTGSGQDGQTAEARACADYMAVGPKGFTEWVDEIVGQKLDVLIYSEVGMDALSLKLASMRLAPAQAVTWGHPETSGLPTIDYYLSAEDLEPPGAQDNYREKLITLPHLGCYYEPLSVEEMDLDLEDLGVDTSVPILICPGLPFKYVPKHDWMFIEIAKKLTRCQFVFFHFSRENLSEKVEQRLEAAFDDAGMFFHSYGIFLPFLSRPAFYALMRRATVFLDTIGFSGFNTAMQAIECGLPVVTKEGHFMRGRLASAILKRMDMRDLVANSGEEYVDLVVRLASDKEYSDQVRRRIQMNRGGLFKDDAPIRALESFLIQARAAPSATTIGDQECVVPIAVP
jgi:protein O-GlcNAc transferase